MLVTFDEAPLDVLYSSRVPVFTIFDSVLPSRLRSVVLNVPLFSSLLILDWLAEQVKLRLTNVPLEII